MSRKHKRAKTLQFMLDGKYEFDKPIEELDTQILELEDYLLQTRLDAKIKPLRERLEQLRSERDRLCREVYSKLTPWQKVLVARHPLRPTTMDYVETMLEDFLELHGDKRFGDDKAMVCGFAYLSDRDTRYRIMLVGHEKGRMLTERMERNFGCAHPEGYRKALDKMHLAEKFGLPIICLIDTPGAYPGIGAEERGQAFAIAQNIMEMAQLKTPIIAAVIGEGGSGGALGIGVADRILMLQYSYYSVISPEGCAAILWRGEEKEHLADAANILKLTADDLYNFDILDEIVPEPLGGAHRDHNEAARLLKEAIIRNLKEILKKPIDELLDERYKKYRRIGRFVENREREVSGARVERSGGDS